MRRFTNSKKLCCVAERFATLFQLLTCMEAKNACNSDELFLQQRPFYLFNPFHIRLFNPIVDVVVIETNQRNVFGSLIKQ